MTKHIEKELDQLVQQLHKNQFCRVCAKTKPRKDWKDADAIHHIISRKDKMLRYDILNLLPVCFDCHREIHDKGFDVFSILPEEHAGYLKQVKNHSYKDWLIFEAQMTEDEYLRDCRKRLRELVNN